MQEASLGSILAQTLQEEKSNTRTAALRVAQAKSGKELADFQAVENFFEKAKEHFTEGIKKQIPTKYLGFLLGMKDPVESAFMDTYHALLLYRTYDPPLITKPTHKFHSLWAEFCEWAKSNGLVPSWKLCHDGVGIHSWLELHVAPSSDAAALAPEFVNPNDVRRQHNYCLHVLYNTLHSLDQAYVALCSLQGHPVAASAVENLEGQVLEARKILKQLEE